jgi:hypothetical protein
MLTQRHIVPCVLAWTLSSCALRTPQPPAAPALEAPAAAVPAGARVFGIDSARTTVTMLVRRDGPLARLGHNHVVVSAQESGRAWIGADPAGSGFEIALPVAAFVVDDPAARAAAGPDFAGEVPEAAREGTYRNLQRPEVLDAARHPLVSVRSSRIAGDWERPRVVAAVTLRGTTREIEVPVELRRGPDGLVALGRLRLRQSEFGITPFSVGGGAIQVADEVEVIFEIAASAR